jgi:hypothetical protein
MKAKTTKIDMPNNQQLENIVLGSILIDSTALDRVIADFSYTVTKRGQTNHDLWNVSVSMEEV